MSNGKLGAVGFCFGGYMVNYLAAVDSELLSAGVPFYGTPASKELRKNIKAPLMVQLGELDKRVNASWPEYEKISSQTRLITKCLCIKMLIMVSIMTLPVDMIKKMPSSLGIDQLSSFQKS